MGSKAFPLEDEINRLRVTIEPRMDGDGFVAVSHNWCDPTTWYSDSVQDSATLADSGDGRTFTSGIPNWIDLKHGRVYREDLVASAYPVVVTVNDVPMTERAPFADTEGDFIVDYAAGSVTFEADQSGKTVAASFYRENGSAYYLRPDAGKRLWIERSEVQFSSDVDIVDTIHFAPFATIPGVGDVQVAAATTYKRAQDFVDEANGTYPQVPAFGGTSRGLSVPHLVFPFNYLSLKDIKSSQGLFIKVWLETDNAYGGAFATATFYCTSHDDPDYVA